MANRQARSAPRAGRNLYVMLKPPRVVAERIAAHPRARRDRRADLFHVTVQPVIDLTTLPPDLAPRVRDKIVALCGTIDAAVFEARMDRIVDSGRTVALRPGRALAGADAFHAAVRTALTRDGFPLMPYSFAPHLTIAYQPDGRGSEAIEPVQWQVDEVRLIESVVGEARHIELGRWRLAPHQHDLFH